MRVARRFIAGFGTTWGRVPEGRPDTAARSIPKISFFKADTVFHGFMRPSRGSTFDKLHRF